MNWVKLTTDNINSFKIREQYFLVGAFISGNLPCDIFSFTDYDLVKFEDPELKIGQTFTKLATKDGRVIIGDNGNPVTVQETITREHYEAHKAEWGFKPWKSLYCRYKDMVDVARKETDYMASMNQVPFSYDDNSLLASYNYICTIENPIEEAKRNL